MCESPFSPFSPFCIFSGPCFLSLHAVERMGKRRRRRKGNNTLEPMQRRRREGYREVGYNETCKGKRRLPWVGRSPSPSPQAERGPQCPMEERSGRGIRQSFWSTKKGRKRNTKCVLYWTFYSTFRKVVCFCAKMGEFYSPLGVRRTHALGWVAARKGYRNRGRGGEMAADGGRKKRHP